MKILFTAIALLFAFILIIYSVGMNTENGFSEDNYMRPLQEEDADINIKLSGNNGVYTSSQQMDLNATIGNCGNYDNLTIRVYGIKDNRGNYRVSEERTVFPDSGTIEEAFSFRMPSCYGCAGVSPGDYEIVMEVIKDGEIIGNSTHTVTLEK